MMMGIRASAGGMPSARRALVLGYLSLAVLVFGFGGWAVFSAISGAVVATGQLEVAQKRQVVQHPDGGVVADILVREGDSVAAGQTLVRLDGSLLLSERGIVAAQLHEIRARRGRLEAERADAPAITFPPDLLAGASPEVLAQLDGQKSLFEARRDTLRKSLDQIDRRLEQTRSMITGLDAQGHSLREQKRLIGAELRDQKSLLERGLAQAARVLALEREAASLDGQLGEVASSRAQGESRISELELEVLRMSSERREAAETELRDVGYRELELTERRRTLDEQIAQLDLRAPVAGVVYDMGVTTLRSVIRAADPVLYIVPQDRPPVIEAQISPMNIDKVVMGQPAILRFPAFSARTTPELTGMVSRISADALTDQTTRARYYNAEITLDPGEREKLGGIVLLPGMPVEAFIQTGAHSPLDYLLKPFTDYFSRSMRG